MKKVEISFKPRIAICFIYLHTLNLFFFFFIISDNKMLLKYFILDIGVISTKKFTFNYYYCKLALFAKVKMIFRQIL